MNTRKPKITCCLYCRYYGLLEFDGFNAPCTAFNRRNGTRMPFQEPFFKCGSFAVRQYSPLAESGLR